ncbi:MAG TPA: DUF4251 domain-containing protein [Hanamia sp.]|nr:DUF4251 domain-containing protein [Hanamia sp.]
MKRINILRSIKFLLSAFLLSFLLSQCSSTKKATNLTSDEVKDMVNSSQFVFVADRVTPLRGTSRFLSSYYDVVIKKDSLTCYLPFFGRAFQAPMDPTKGGIQFTSTNFSYNITTKKNNEWVVTIKPNDYQDVQQLYFNIFDNGTASLNVVNTHRDPITFSGHIKKLKE